MTIIGQIFSLQEPAYSIRAAKVDWTLRQGWDIYFNRNYKMAIVEHFENLS